MSLDDAEHGIQHIQRLVALVESLRAPHVFVYQHEWHELAMGSWSLSAGTRHCSNVFNWDGGDGVISRRGPFHVGQSNGSRSPSIADEQLDIPPSVDPFQYVERFFQSHPSA